MFWKRKPLSRLKAARSIENALLRSRTAIALAKIDYLTEMQLQRIRLLRLDLERNISRDSDEENT